MSHSRSPHPPYPRTGSSNSAKSKPKKSLPKPLKQLVRWLLKKDSIQKNGIQKNGIQKNGIQKNGIQKNGIQKNAVKAVKTQTAQTRRERSVQSSRSPHKVPPKTSLNMPQKVFWAGGSVATLAVLAIVPGQVGSQAIAPSTCQQVIQSGAEISRDKLSRLAAIPQGTPLTAVREVLDQPYCLLPVPDAMSDAEKNETTKKENPEKTDSQAANGSSREAYPLAFDPTAWVVVNYEAEAYAGYDFVFKP